MNDPTPTVGHVTNADTRAVDGLAALGWLNTASVGTEHVALPIDLLMLTVHHAPDGSGDRDVYDGDAGDMALTSLRTQPDRFRSQRHGELAFALLTPAGLMRLGGAPLDGRTDCRLGLDELCSTIEHRQLSDRLAAASDSARRMHVLGHWIEQRLTQRRGLTGPQARVAHATQWLHERREPLSRPDIRRLFGVSPRQLERDFRQWLGVSPNGYARLVRFQRAAQGVAAHERLIDAALQNEFTDQPHMNRSFRRLSAMTPRELAVRAAQPHRVLERRALAGRVVVVDAPPNGISL